MILISGRLNNAKLCNFWEVPEHLYDEFRVGDYAVVPNMNDYDLVKIVGIMDTDEKYLKHLVPGGKVKTLVSIIHREVIRED